ncbi:hypothetical protein HNR06_004289 [Nocardiopsis arvandica]|uniref:CHRD domain-containing protein n=1 Tax=Nocardiopsis sinuspersici TaxID=501010 RepID=A0A7Y9XHD7_9ACTN|nr:hypothetical protein [Nocardiopsis sinuspersici]NYH54700.1 hypothetical protein [Nocardiopsis sinuspersici]
MKNRKLALLAFALPVGALTAASPAWADESTTLHADLAPLNDSGASGTSTVTVEGTRVTVDIDTSGLLAEQPHAQHFHIGGTNMCPSSDAVDDVEDDDRLSTTEGQPSYGGIEASLTTEGDTSPDSALAVERFPAADADGNVSYQRTFEVSADVASAIEAGEAVIVQHGVDYNGNGEYDAEGGGASDLDPELPAEATDPATCGKLTPAPEGGMAAGGGGTGSEGLDALALGSGAALVAVAGAGFLARKRMFQGR